MDLIKTSCTLYHNNMSLNNTYIDTDKLNTAIQEYNDIYKKPVPVTVRSRSNDPYDYFVVKPEEILGFLKDNISKDNEVHIYLNDNMSHLKKETLEKFKVVTKPRLILKNKDIKLISFDLCLEEKNK